MYNGHVIQSVQDSVDSLYLLRYVRSPSDRKLLDIIKSTKGGARAFIEDDKQLKRLFEASQDLEQSKRAGPTDKRALDNIASTTISTIKLELTEDIEKVLATNSAIFSRRLTSTINDIGENIVLQLKAGLHDYITDPVNNFCS